MKKAFKRITAAVLSFSVLCGLGAAMSSADDKAVGEGKYDYTITSAYDGVDWDTWSQYRAALHTHTNISDGFPTIEECVKKHYDLGYQILDITDHATLGVRWDEAPQLVPIFRLVKFERSHLKEPEVLTSEEREQIIGGTYESTERDAAAEQRGESSLGGMLEITGCCEANGATPINDCHLITFGCSETQARLGLYGDYETTVKRAQDEGGYSFLCHTGEYMGCEDDEPRATHPYYVNKFASLFLTYDSCVAYDVNSGENDRTRYDIDTYDGILQLTIPKGRTVANIAFSDGHAIDEYDRAFTMMLMPELTREAFDNCMKTGAWFSCARYARKQLGEDFCGEGMWPYVNKINVDNDKDVISFTGHDYDHITWISNGKVIAEDVTTLDLDDYGDEIGCYVRFELTGPGGILYSQPFVTLADGVEYSSTVYKTFDIGSILRIIANWFDVFLGHTWFVTIVKRVLLNRIF